MLAGEVLDAVFEVKLGVLTAEVVENFRAKEPFGVDLNFLDVDLVRV